MLKSAFLRILPSEEGGKVSAWVPGSESHLCFYCSAILGKLPNLSEPPIPHAHSGNHGTSLLGHQKPLDLTLAQGKASIIEVGGPAKNLWEEETKVSSRPVGKAGLGVRLGENLISAEDCGSSHSFPACPLQGGDLCRLGDPPG